MNNFAPVVLFVYNRPEHTKKTLSALARNATACNTKLYIFADGPKENASESLIKKIKETRDICRAAKGFNEVIISESEKNKGLAKNIIDGVTEIINIYGRVIVLEDDLVVNSCFLDYMNNALEKYENNSNVWHISAWMYPFREVVDSSKSGFQKIMHCWGWGTWKDKWNKLNLNSDYFINKFTKEQIKDFSCSYKTDFWLQMLLNKDNVYNTWAIFWYATIFDNQGLCLSPYKSLVSNCGMDNSGEHSSINTSCETESVDFDVSFFPKDIVADVELEKNISYFLRCNYQKKLMLKYVLQKIGLYGFFRNMKKKLGKR